MCLNPERIPESESLEELRASLEAESSDSIRLLNDLSDNPICSVHIDERVPCVEVVWKQYANRKQFQFIHESILKLLAQNNVSRILADDTALPIIHIEDQVWVLENWMPRAITAGLKFTANKKPGSYFGRLSVNRVLSSAPEGLTCRSFEDFSEARQWLQGVRQELNQ